MYHHIFRYKLHTLYVYDVICKKICICVCIKKYLISCVFLKKITHILFYNVISKLNKI